MTDELTPDQRALLLLLNSLPSTRFGAPRDWASRISELQDAGFVEPVSVEQRPGWAVTPLGRAAAAMIRKLACSMPADAPAEDLLAATPDDPSEVRELVARAIYAALDPNDSDPFDAAVARKNKLQSGPSPMVAQAYAAGDAALNAIRRDHVILPRNTDWINEANDLARAQWPCATSSAAKEPRA